MCCVTVYSTFGVRFRAMTRRRKQQNPPLVTVEGKRVAVQTVERLSTYRRVLEDLHSTGVQYVYSHQLAQYVDVTPAQLRRDLSSFGSFGNISRGYDVLRLIATLSNLLGTTRVQSIALVGLGNLGRTLLAYRGFLERGFSIDLVFDSDPAKIGRVIAGRRCHDIEDAPQLLAERNVTIAVLACRAQGLQKLINQLAEANVKSFLSFVPALITLPPGVHIELVDISAKLEKLSFLNHSVDTVAQATTVQE